MENRIFTKDTSIYLTKAKNNVNMHNGSNFNLVAQNPQSTVVSEYSFDTAQESNYQIFNNPIYLCLN